MNVPQSIRKILDALAYSNAGDYLSLSQKRAVLSDAKAVNHAVDFAAPLAQSTKARIGLYLGSELPEDMMQYVLRTCSQMHYQLSILTQQSQKDVDALLAPYHELLAAAGLQPTVTPLSGDPVNALTTALRRQPDIAFLVCNETGYLGRSMLSGTQNLLPVPVVLVSHGNPAVQSEQARTERAA